MQDHPVAADAVWLNDQACDLAAFEAHVSRSTRAADYPMAAEIADNIPVYDGASLRECFASEATARQVMAEHNRGHLQRSP